MELILIDTYTGEEKTLNLVLEQCKDISYIKSVFVKELNLNPSEIEIDAYYPHAWIALEKDTFLPLASLAVIEK